MHCVPISLDDEGVSSEFLTLSLSSPRDIVVENYKLVINSCLCFSETLQCNLKLLTLNDWDVEEFLEDLVSKDIFVRA